MSFFLKVVCFHCPVFDVCLGGTVQLCNLVGEPQIYVRQKKVGHGVLGWIRVALFDLTDLIICMS